MNRTKVLLILGVGALVLWETLSWGTRTWVKYGLMKEPLPSIATFVPTSMIFPIVTTVLTISLIAVMAIAVIRSRKLFGLIPIEDLKRHVVILGPTGSGKTTVAKSIIEKALRSAKDIKVIIIDWKGEYHFPGATIIRKLTIWDVPGDSPRERALMATEMIREISKDVVEVTPSSSLLLLRVLEEEYKRGVPTTEAIMAILDRYAQIAQREGKFAEANMYFALLRRLYVILADEERKAENVEGDPRILVYDLARLPSIYIKTLYANYILATLYRSATKAGTGERLKTLLIAEEAQNYVRPRRHDELPSIAERLIFELRAFGVGVILVCPDPELLPQPLLKDVGAIIATSPDAVPRFALERYLFRTSLEEAEDVLKRMKKAKAIIYYKNRLHFLRRLPTPKLKPKARPKGDRMGVTDPGGRSLRAWPILPHRSPGRPKVVEVEESAGKPKVEIKEESMATPKVVEVVEKAVEKSAIREELRLEEEEEYEESETITTEPAEEPAVKVKEVEEEIKESEPAPEGPPIPSTLPYRGSLCPAGRTATSGRSL